MFGEKAKEDDKATDDTRDDKKRDGNGFQQASASVFLQEQDKC